MSLDVRNAPSVAGGETHMPSPFVIEGLFVEPPVQIVSSQATGVSGASVLRSGLSGGRARLVDYVKDFTPSEVQVGGDSPYTDEITTLINGNAVWFTAVAVQHRPAATISIVWVASAVTLFASVVVPTLAEIETAIDGTNQSRYVILGDILFHRSADTVINHQVSNKRRPAYVEETNKTSAMALSTDHSTMALEYGGHMDFPVTLASVCAESAGTLVSNAKAPAWPFGGVCGQLEYIPAVAGTGVVADILFRPNVTNVNETVIAANGDDFQLVLADSAVGSNPSNTAGPGNYTTAPEFKPDAILSIELQTKTSVFSAGSGVIRMHLWKNVPAGR